MLCVVYNELVEYVSIIEGRREQYKKKFALKFQALFTYCTVFCSWRDLAPVYNYPVYLGHLGVIIL